MKFLKVLGWIFVPYIMVWFGWKERGKAGRIFGVVWAVIAALMVLTPKD
ncbi:nuclease precursor, partial [Brevibacillus centrosporus]